MIDIVGSIADCMCNQGAAPFAIKTEVDLARYEAIIDTIHPSLILETGTAQGGSALWFANRAGCPVITIDVAPNVPEEVFKRWDGRVTAFVTDSTNPDLVAAITGALRDDPPGGPVMVVLDSDHSAAHVAAEIVAWSPLVTVGSYMVVEDTLVRYLPWFFYEGSPWDAVDDFLAGNTAWGNDMGIESMFATSQHPGGWLKRLA